MNVRDVMTPDPITIEPQAAVGTAIAVMIERGVRHLPVVDDDGRLVGIVTDRDVRGAAMLPELAEHLSVTARRRLLDLGARLDDLRVRDVMSWSPVTIGPDAPVHVAAALMFERRVGSLPVVDGGRVVGIVTERDVLKTVGARIPDLGGVDLNWVWG
jgi:acetoin utilization protein AcuB